MPVRKKTRKPVKDNWPKVRVSLIANTHLEKLVATMKKRGLVVTKTSIASEAILSIPMPNGSAAAMEMRALNKEVSDV